MHSFPYEGLCLEP